jgi:peptide deformylase
MIREVLRWPDARLQQACPPAPVDAPETVRLVRDLLDTLYAAQGRGLAAPQIGEMLQVFVMDVGWKEGNPSPRVLINPRIEEISDDMEAAEEQCLSIPGIAVSVERPLRVRMPYDKVDGAGGVETFEGFAARCALHEFDHLEGRVTLDHLDAAARAAMERAYEAGP